MDLTLAGLLTAARNTVADPRAAARWLIGLNLPLNVAMTALVLVAVLSTLLAHLSFAMMPAAMREGFGSMMGNPIGTAIVQVTAAVFGAAMVYRIGKWRGGRGTLAQSATLLAWLQFVLLIVQVAQIVAEIILPPFAVILGYVGLGLFFWLLVSFVMELHGFRSAFATFFGILFFMMLFGFVISLLFLPMMPAPTGM
jgi:hypothetical protein